MYNVNTRGIHTSNVVVGMALFGGGLTQFIAGMWEFPRGNVFGATVLTMYGAFWMSYATIFIPGSGVMLAFSDETEFNNAFGMYLIVWLILTLLFIPPVVRRNMAFTILLSTLAVTLIMLSGAEFTGSPRLTKAGGVFGIMTGLIAFYIAESELLASEARAIVRLPLGELAQ
ncbi:Ammonia transport outward protein 2 [Termitomyces sp. J132]|nr:Ammonia transport outward protein 2 [Termitomyces sp. J132]